MIKHNQDGHVLTWVLGFMAAISIIIFAASSVIDLTLGDALRTNKNQLSLNIADAGVNYYLWHMSHAGADFQDGNTGGSTIVGGEFDGFYGPYEHEYKDDNGNTVGKYTLYIKPKSAGSTVAIVRSVGESVDGKYTRTVEAEIGAPSFASYGLLTNSAVYFGATGSVNGPVHSNVGMRLDAPNSGGDATSANTTYTPGTSLGGTTNSSQHPGVWCNGGTNCASRNTTKNNGTWRYPVPSIDFNSVTGEICNIKKKAFEANASTASLATSPTACNTTSVARTSSYIPHYQATYGRWRGYLIELNTNGTYNLYGVSNETYNYTNNSNYTYQWQTALSETLIQSNIVIPEPSVIFVEDNVWVRTNPTFNGRVTIAAARLTGSSSDKANVVIADDIRYSTKNGQDVIGIIAENNILIAPYAAPRPSDSGFPFEIQAALIAKDGFVGVSDTYGSGNRDYPYWNDSNKKYIYYGSNAVFGVPVSLRTGGSDSDGFQYRETTYDFNLLYAPPPSFPITSTYDILKWREILVTP